MATFCRKCGVSNEPDASYCESCGVPLERPQVSSAPHIFTPRATVSRWIWIAVTAFLIVGGGIAASLVVPSSTVPRYLAKLGIRPPTFGSTTADTTMLYPVREQGKWGFVDRAGNIVIPMQFEAIKNQEFGDGVTTADLIAVRTEGLWGFIDRTGRFVIAPKFGDVDQCYVYQLYDDPKACDFFREGLTPVRVGKKWGYIDRYGKFVIQPQFDEARRFTPGGLAIAKLGTRF